MHYLLLSSATTTTGSVVLLLQYLLSLCNGAVHVTSTVNHFNILFFEFHWYEFNESYFISRVAHESILRKRYQVFCLDIHITTFRSLVSV